MTQNRDKATSGGCDDGTESANAVEPDRLLGSVWRDEHGNAYRVCGTSGYGDDATTVTLRYVPPTGKKLTLGELRGTHTLEAEGDLYPFVRRPAERAEPLTGGLINPEGGPS